MTQAAKKQRKVIGRMINGELHIIAEVVQFVSSRLGDVSCETEREHESEWHRVAVTDGRSANP
jgi:hypothetical protein